MNTNKIRFHGDGFKGLKENWKSGSVHCLSIFLIGVSVCRDIVKASGFPSMAGIYAAIMGGILASWFMSARFDFCPATGKKIEPQAY